MFGRLLPRSNAQHPRQVYTAVKASISFGMSGKSSFSSADGVSLLLAKNILGVVRHGVGKAMLRHQIRSGAGGWVRDTETDKETELASGTSGVAVIVILMSAFGQATRWTGGRCVKVLGRSIVTGGVERDTVKREI